MLCRQVVRGGAEGTAAGDSSTPSDPSAITSNCYMQETIGYIVLFLCQHISRQCKIVGPQSWGAASKLQII